MTSTPQPFVVTFEYAKRSFKCVRLDWSEVPADGRTTAQWVVTLAGRPVWSFDIGPADTKESVQAQVQQWWDAESARRDATSPPSRS